jgi:hypothetical protein
VGMKRPTPFDSKARRTQTRRAKRRHRRAQAGKVRTRRVKESETSARLRARGGTMGLDETKELLERVFVDLHEKRVLSLANYSVGAMNASSAAIHVLGASYAEVAGTVPKHGIKQVDRYLSNTGINIEELTPYWAQFVIGERAQIMIALDWTEFQPDDHTTLCAYLVTNHGRATPFVWKTYRKSLLTDGARTIAEHAFVDRLALAIPSNISLILLADRGFGSQALYENLDLLGWDYVIRFRSSVFVEKNGVTKLVREWLPPSGRATKLLNAKVTLDGYQVGTVVLVKKKRMKDAWYLATSLKAKTASAIVKLYGRRFTIEETFRDHKDLHFGMGLSSTHIHKPERRDRLLMLLAIAHVLLTLLGAASERAGLDAYLKANTVKRRTHSLFRQGSYWYRCIPTMCDKWFARLITAFDAILAEHRSVSQLMSFL